MPVEKIEYDLRPCPYCGSSEIGFYQIGQLDNITQYIIVCESCGCGTKTIKSRETAIKTWNSRVRSSIHSRDIEKLLTAHNALRGVNESNNSFHLVCMNLTGMKETYEEQAFMLIQELGVIPAIKASKKIGKMLHEMRRGS